jgi:O-antigen ligase
MLLTAEGDMAAGEEQTEEEEDSYANGRMEIFKLYYKHLNKNGHDDMGIMQPDGTFTVHAHNIYLQVAYDHGIFVGVVFILLGAATLVQAAIYYHKRKDDTLCALLPLALLILFGVAGLTEWIFHPCCPIAYCFLLTLAPLLVDMRHCEWQVINNRKK